MPTLLSIADLIPVGEVGGAYCSLYESKKALFGGSIIHPTPARQIFAITEALKLAVDRQTAQQQRNLGNYLYWLCGKFGLEAQNVIYGPGGGSVSPTPPAGTTPNGFDFVVDVTAGPTNPVKAGDTSTSIPSLIGFNIIFNRNNIPQSTINVGSSYYTWNKALGIFSCFDVPVEGELFQIIPV